MTLRLQHRAIQMTPAVAPGITDVCLPYVAINHYEGRRHKRQGHGVLIVLLVLTAVVVAAALTRI